MSMTITREQLEQCLSKSDNQSVCVELLAEATEANRRALAPVALAWYRTAYAAWMGRNQKPEITLPCPDDAGFLMNGIMAAVLATATWNEMRKLPDWNSIDTTIDPDVAFNVLSARKPEWIDEWAEAFVTQDPRNWHVVRRLVRAGICSRSDSDAMISGMIAGIDDVIRHDLRGIRQRLLDDPELLDHEIWRLFEVQRPNSLNFAARDEFRQGSQAGWLESFVLMANADELPRERLLDCSLNALECGFSDSFARWFPKLHEALQPSLEERLEFLPRYWEFLRNANTSTVTFALDVLQKLDAAGKLADEDLIHHLPVILHDKSKSRAKLGLKLLERVSKRSPRLANDVALAICPALSHAAADVQEAAWKVIDRLGTAPAQDLIDAVHGMSPYIAASMQERVQQWLRRFGDGSSATDLAGEAVSAEETQKVLDNWIQCARALPQHLATVAGIPALLEAIANGSSSVPAVDLRSWDFPRLVDPIVPISSLEELIDTCAAALESIESADEVERILAGISQLCDVRPDDFDQRTGPLKKRTLAKLKGHGGTFMGDCVIADLNATIWAWLTGEVSHQVIMTHNVQNLWGSTAGGETWITFPPGDTSWLRDAFSQRALAIARRAARRESLSLLSAPTHSGGWIDPVTLVARVEELGDRLNSIPEFDQALALLRLAPDHRAAALTAWQATPAVDRDCEFHRALSHALGAEQTVVGPTVSLWCAAARARGAWTNDPLVMAQHRAAGPDAGQAADVQLKFHPADEHPGKIILTVKPQRVSLPARPGPPLLPAGRLRDDFKLPDREFANPNPIWLLHDGLCRFWLCPGGPLAVRWALTVWPANPDPLLAHGLFHLKSNIDWETKLWANRVYLQCLLPANTPVSPLARLVLVVGLAAKDSEESGIAVDVAITAIADGRLNGLDLGEMLRNVLLTGNFKVARWAKALKEIAGPTVLHAHTVSTALARVFTGDTACGTRDLALLLELLHELTLQTGLGIPAATRDWLERYVGTGKGAKAVKSILAASPVTKPEQLRELHLAALQARVDRVRNWGLLEAATEPQFSSEPMG
ncbi:MAG: hypothetical protein JSS49_18215 [Planctomycetes bacterium]|nr:hypothetical protein [Planctomycetota bacterium]